MASTDLTTNIYQSLNALGLSIRAFVELAHVLPEEDQYAPLLLVLADRLEGDFTAMRNTIKLWGPAESKRERAER
ncbi:hypothetical protein [Aeromonas veronii]|uniref:hypothetical protein n=1 Tax=Aeromonas veronii TaxID=654 RepID=UPI0015DC1EFD|nr:hypothetical protein [Aeromonas veronii]BBU07058.1 hypothetical protein WP9W18E04_P40010 [Aeromonas veronii]